MSTCFSHFAIQVCIATHVLVKSLKQELQTKASFPVLGKALTLFWRQLEQKPKPHWGQAFSRVKSEYDLAQL